MALDIRHPISPARAIGLILDVLAEVPESGWTRRVRSIAERALKTSRGVKPGRPGSKVGTHLHPLEERRRREVHQLRLTDREAGRRLGISGQAYNRWRLDRGLPAWHSPWLQRR